MRPPFPAILRQEALDGMLAAIAVVLTELRRTVPPPASEC
jgi:hypothetical protein